MADAMIRAGTYRVVGPGDNVLHHTHVDDVVEGVWLAATRPEAAGDHFILAGPETTTLAACRRSWRASVDRPLPRVTCPRPWRAPWPRWSTSRRTAASPSRRASRPVDHEKLDGMTLPSGSTSRRRGASSASLPRVGYEEGVLRTLAASGRRWRARERARDGERPRVGHGSCRGRSRSPRWSSSPGSSRVRDRCWDPRAAASTHVAVSRDDARAACCTSRPARSASTRPSAPQLRCEPGVASAFAHARLGILVAAAGGSTASARSPGRRGGARCSPSPEIELPLWQVWRVSIEAQAGGILLPGGIGGDALRIASVLAQAHAKRAAGRARVDRGRLGPARPRRRPLGRRGARGGAGLRVRRAAAQDRSRSCWRRSRSGSRSALAVLRVAPVHRRPVARPRAARRLVEPVLEYVRDPRAPAAIAVAAALSFVVAGDPVRDHPRSGLGARRRADGGEVGLRRNGDGLHRRRDPGAAGRVGDGRRGVRLLLRPGGLAARAPRWRCACSTGSSGTFRA